MSPTLTSMQVVLHWGHRGHLWVHEGWRCKRNHSRYTRNVVWIHRRLSGRYTVCFPTCLIYWAQQRNNEPSVQSKCCQLHDWCFVLLTVPWTAAGLRTAAAADVAAAWVRTTLAPADPHQQQEQDASQDHRAHKRPLLNKDTQTHTWRDFKEV